jgi:hypothetical protein
MDHAWACGHGERVGRRGLLPSLGAGTSLIVAGVLCLLVVSGYVAFHGFPSLGLDGSPPPVRLARPVADRVAGVTPAIRLGAGGSSLVRLASVSDRLGRGRGERGSRRSVGVVATTPTPPTTAPAPSPGPNAGDATEVADSSATGDDQQANQVAPEVRPVRNAVDTVRNAVPVPTVAPPPAVKPVVDATQPVVDDVAGAVDEGIDTADDIVGGLLPGG